MTLPETSERHGGVVKATLSYPVEYSSSQNLGQRRHRDEISVEGGEISAHSSTSDEKSNLHNKRIQCLERQLVDIIEEGEKETKTGRYELIMEYY